MPNHHSCGVDLRPKKKSAAYGASQPVQPDVQTSCSPVALEPRPESAEVTNRSFQHSAQIPIVRRNAAAALFARLTQMI
jgi:hypothetical protein